MTPLQELETDRPRGARIGVTSVCSAHPMVLIAAVEQAIADGGVLLVEATSNQVDQFGGYTGMRPADFRDLVLGLVDDRGLPRDRVVLGGDHLGPNRWQDGPSETAMAHAETLVEAYVAAGYTKIHLDCSMSCADDPVPMTNDLAAGRAARLLAVAERTADRVGTQADIRYVIGTEVPVPGGAHEELGALVPTSPDAARATIDAHRRAIESVGHADAWSRIMALVVQPGVEFDHLKVVDYRPEATLELQRVVESEPHMVFEAHSTDYQTPGALATLVQDHWGVLKVGPGLTFALREALFALAAIEDELIPADRRSDLVATIDRRMLAEPAQWERYYLGDPDEQRIARRYSYSDRMRYYWPDPEISAAEQRLLDNLAAVTIPEPLVSQWLPAQYARVRDGVLPGDPESLVVDRVRDALRPYSAACNPLADTTSTAASTVTATATATTGRTPAHV
ncbi:tagatose-bisphosphate aldolase [Curtobacterium sp. Leaf261]|nr:tagatose-bisphosphate aldolase [Curtobacterium sp. Leaf261]